MGRLTFKQANGTWGLVNGDIKRVPSELYGAICKLKDYEESGLSPEQLEMLNVVYAKQREELLEKRERLKAYETTGITPEQIIEMDRLYRERCEEIADLKKQLAAGAGWIPADNPPKPDEYILLSFENFSVPMVGRYEVDENGGAFYIGDEEEPCVSQNVFVNAWQPLPEPYNSEVK